MKDFISTDWTDERLTRARELKSAGMSAARIAAEIGGNATRNSVIGMLSRLNKGVTPRQVRSNHFVFPRAVPTCLNSLGVAPASETTHVLSIFDLKINQCRWPLGDPTDARFTYCGAPRDGMKPYCAHHRALAYLPVLTRAERAAMAR